MLGYRLINNVSLLIPRSQCPKCSSKITWHDNIPLFSWLFLKGKCRSCKKTISFLYPLIEVLTAIALSLLWLLTPDQFFLSYFIFFSALIITIRTDLEKMLISRYVTLFLIPLGYFLSALKLLPISPLESLLGSFFGYFLLLCIAKTFLFLTGKTGMGQGDLDLLAFIGSFTGIIGCWISVVIGSTLGSILGIIYLVIVKPKHSVRIPFGPFLAIGSFLYVLYSEYIFSLF